MKYHMKRPERELKDNKEIDEVLKDGKYATVALCENSEPYIVALSYGYDSQNRVFYFHAAKHGAKIDFIKSNPNASLMVIKDNGYIQGKCVHTYRSVIVRGVMELVQDEKEKRHGIEVLIDQLEEKPETTKALLDGKTENYDTMQILKLRVIDITGKEGK